MSDNNKCNINQGLMYIIIALSSEILTSFFWKLIYLGPIEDSFVAKVEFAATLSSIILSVVAIVFTFIQSKQSESTTSKVVDASDMIQKHSETLNTSVTKIEGEVNSLKDMNIETVLKTHLDKFDKKLDRLDKFESQLDSIKELTCDKLDNVNYLMTSKFDAMLGVKSYNNKDKINDKQKEEHLKCFVEYSLEENEDINYIIYATLKFILIIKENKINSVGKFIGSLTREIEDKNIFSDFSDSVSLVGMISFSLILLNTIGIMSNSAAAECTIDISDTIANFELMSANEQKFKKLSSSLNKVFKELELNT